MNSVEELLDALKKQIPEKAEQIQSIADDLFGEGMAPEEVAPGESAGPEAEEPMAEEDMGLAAELEGLPQAAKKKKKGVPSEEEMMF